MGKCGIRLCAEARNELDRDTAMIKGKNITNTRLVGAECPFENVQTRNGVGNGSTGGGISRELMNDVEPLSIDQIQWWVSDIHIPDRVKD
jgi:hypothetical protein